MGETFWTPATRGTAEMRIKGSTFLALAAPARDEEEARAVLAGVEKEHFNATHNCSAWRLHDDLWRANDDGEPSGSAGAPILAAIDGAGLVNCIVVVTRYFGGTKLGVGGLIRAYGDCAALVLDGLPRQQVVRALRTRVRYPYEHTNAVMRALEHVDAHEVEHGYSGQGQKGEVTFAMPRTREPVLRDFLREQTAGELAPEVLSDYLLYLHPEA